jgi:hypothetical protein
MKKSRHRRSPAHKVSQRQRADAITALSKIVGSDAQPYVVAKAAAALLNTSARDEDLPEVDPDAPRTIIFLPRKDRHPGQREDESTVEWKDRIKAKVEGRRAAYCEHIGIPYDPMKALPCWPWPVPGSDPDLEAEVDRRVDEAEAAKVERQRANPRRLDPVEVLGPRADHPGGVILYDAGTPEGREDYERWRAEAAAAGHAIIGPQ